MTWFWTPDGWRRKKNKKKWFLQYIDTLEEEISYLRRRIKILEGMYDSEHKEKEVLMKRVHNQRQELKLLKEYRASE